MIHAATGTNLKNLMLSEISQTEKIMYYMTPLYEIFRLGKSIETEHRLVLPGANRRGE